MAQLKGVCVGAGYFSHFQYEAWQRIPEVTITTRGEAITVVPPPHDSPDEIVEKQA